jgi:hypothetical protein
MHARVGLITIVLSVAFCVTPLAAQESLTLQFGGKRLVIPRAYFDKGGRWDFTPDTTDPDHVFLRVYFPEFGVKPTRPRPDAGFGDYLRVQLYPRPSSLNIRYASIAAARADGPLEDRHELKYFATTPNRAGAEIGAKRKEVYFSHRDGAVTVLIICEPEGSSSPCQQYFSTADFSFRLTYRMNNLPDWRNIETRVRSIVEGFVAR